LRGWSPIVVAVLALAGCGSSGPTVGRTEIIFPGVGGIEWIGPLVIDTSGENAIIRSVCMFGSETVTMVGNGEAARWSGEVVCPPITLRDCDSVTISLTSIGGITINADKSQSAQGNGKGHACGIDADVTDTFENY
jgi:hypothetical protein